MATIQTFAGLGTRAATSLSRLPSLSGVGHPIWLGALAVLLVNDHLLKGAQLLPAWLTGKLSDFAGLIVAPVLLAALVRGRRTAARWACVAVVGCGFAAIKLFPAAAHGVEAAMAAAHWSWRIWSDPTDLAALVVLPIAFRLTRATPRRRAALDGMRRFLQPASVIAGALACVATSYVKPSDDIDSGSTTLLLQNRTGRAVPLTWYEYNFYAPLDCAALAAGNHDALAPIQFTVRGCLSLADGLAYPFGQVTIATPPADASAPSGCAVAALRAPGLPDTVLIWRTQPAPSSQPDQDRLYLDTAGTGLAIGRTDYVESWPADFTLPRPNCDAGQ